MWGSRSPLGVPVCTMRVLYYIDDLEGDRDLMRRGLAQAGVDSDTAATATEELQGAQDPAYAAILLDVRLPDMPGEVVAQRLRARGERRPIIAISGSTSLQAWATPAGSGGFPRLPARPAALGGDIREPGGRHRLGAPRHARRADGLRQEHGAAQRGRAGDLGGTSGRLVRCGSADIR